MTAGETIEALISDMARAGCSPELLGRAARLFVDIGGTALDASGTNSATKAGVTASNMNIPATLSGGSNRPLAASLDAGRARIPYKSIARAAVALLSGRRRKGDLLGGLPPSAVAVAHVLIDAANLISGRCDPKIAKLSERLHMPERTVRRALARLRTAGIIEVRTYAGSARANSYRIDWVECARVVDADGWPARQPAKMNIPATLGKAMAVGTRIPAKNGPPINLEDKSLPETVFVAPAREARTPHQKAGYRLGNDRRQHAMPLPSMGHEVGATSADRAERRLTAAVVNWAHLAGPEGHSALVGAFFALSTQIRDAARDAERRKLGTGLPMIVAALTDVAMTPPTMPPVVSEGLRRMLQP